MYNAVMAQRKNFTFRLDPDVVEAFAKIAEEDHRSLNNMVEVTMLDTLKAHGKNVVAAEPSPETH